MQVKTNIVNIWAQDVELKRCTVEQPSDRVRLAILAARDEVEADKRQKKQRRASPNSTIENLTKAILAGHLAQMTANECSEYSTISTASGSSEEPSIYRVITAWMDSNCWLFHSTVRTHTQFLPSLA